MKFRWAWFLGCAGLGLLLLIAGLLIPAHLRALDAGVVQSAGQSSSKLLEDGQMLAGGKRLGTAAMLLQAAQIEKIPGHDQFNVNLASLARQYPNAVFWGDDSAVENLFGPNFQPADQKLNFSDFIIRRPNRVAALARLQDSPDLTVKELLQTRSINQTAIFSPSASAAGQAFDAALITAGLLAEGGHLMTSLRDEIFNLASQANRGGGSRSLEQVLMDFTSLGERLNWDQLTAFTGQIPNAETLGRLADEARHAGDRLPVLFSVVQLTGQPAAVAGYLAKFPATGLADLGASLRYGAGGISEVAVRDQRLSDPGWERRVTAGPPFSGFFYLAAKYSMRQPKPALAAKWLCYFLAGFLLAAMLHFVRPAVEYPRPVHGFHLLREFLFALGFLLVVLALTEPFLSQDPPGENFSFRLLPPAVGGAFPAEIAGLKQTPMNLTVLLPLLVFFVLQALIYVSCLVKLAEIRRQNVPPRMKLKLLENEDHLFDAGLYLGFVGTIASLIMASQGFVKFSLMAAYSSTCFGIIFVVIFKIFHLRPARRALLLAAEAEAEAENAQVPTRVPAAAPATNVP